MRPNGGAHTFKEKKIAEMHYRNRKIDKFTKWSMQNKGYLKWKDLVAIQDEHNIKVTSQTFIKQLPKLFI
jgi:hypothetical protein